MVAMRVMKSPVDQEIRVVTMGNSLMAAILVGAATGYRNARGGIFRTDFDGMFVHMVTVDVVQVSCMQVIHMVTVLNPGMSAVFTVGVGVIAVSGAVHKKVLSGDSKATGRYRPVSHTVHVQVPA